jgi:tRNA threonylcarbamoyladenosine biosynthesis protein TsaB
MQIYAKRFQNSYLASCLPFCLFGGIFATYMSTKILCIDTSLDVCSVALTIDGEVNGLYLEERGFNIHSERLTLMIVALMKQAEVKLKDLDAICIDKGPGSYTGLRIGVSTAKGLCYALDKPLISLNTLQTMANMALEFTDLTDYKTLLCPMIDARRMEVYYTLLDKNMNFITETKAEVVDENFLGDLSVDKEVLVFGNGMAKCRRVLESNMGVRFLYEDVYPSAKHMAIPAFEKNKRNEFEELFNFEPFYLKDFYNTSTTPQQRTTNNEQRTTNNEQRTTNNE